MASIWATCCFALVVSEIDDEGFWQAHLPIRN